MQCSPQNPSNWCWTYQLHHITLQFYIQNQIYELSTIIPWVKIIFSVISQVGQNNNAPWQESREGEKEKKKQIVVEWGALTGPAPSSPVLWQLQCFTVQPGLLQLRWQQCEPESLKMFEFSYYFGLLPFFFPCEMHPKERKLWCSTVYDSTKPDWIQGTKKWHFFSSWVFFPLTKFKSLLWITEVLEIAFESNHFFLQKSLIPMCWET